ncbi:hypothetical protein GCM10023215_05420 [Pseudonocardia yuanmonensis]|uniref:Uncharacterized protein n=1 Tax=Pseudonocardia yuanmonensis TaxID=1095914 RepID=A0ABP8W126_9PSEU
MRGAVRWRYRGRYPGAGNGGGTGGGARRYRDGAAAVRRAAHGRPRDRRTGAGEGAGPTPIRGWTRTGTGARTDDRGTRRSLPFRGSVPG